MKFPYQSNEIFSDSDKFNDTVCSSIMPILNFSMVNANVTIIQNITINNHNSGLRILTLLFVEFFTY